MLADRRKGWKEAINNGLNTPSPGRRPDKNAVEREKKRQLNYSGSNGGMSSESRT